MATDFPRTEIEGLSVSRLIIGTNWFLGYSHTSQARDTFIKDRQSRRVCADIIATFMERGVDTILGVRPDAPHLNDAVKDAEDRSGRKCTKVGTPVLDLSGTQQAEDANHRTIEAFAGIGCAVCMPHQATTDALVDRVSRRIRDMDRYAAFIRTCAMIPGLSTHMPETVPYADESGLDVGTYIQIYNAAGFLMQVEVDWVHRIIWQACRPVITIKPLAAGRLLPLVGLSFNWATIRDQDMICLGCLTSDEAKECIDISVSQLDRTGPAVALQKTRSKESVG